MGSGDIQFTRQGICYTDQDGNRICFEEGVGPRNGQLDASDFVTRQALSEKGPWPERDYFHKGAIGLDQGLAQAGQLLLGNDTEKEQAVVKRLTEAGFAAQRGDVKETERLLAGLGVSITEMTPRFYASIAAIREQAHFSLVENLARQGQVEQVKLFCDELTAINPVRAERLMAMAECSALIKEAYPLAAGRDRAEQCEAIELLDLARQIADKSGDQDLAKMVFAATRYALGWIEIDNQGRPLPPKVAAPVVGK